MRRPLLTVVIVMAHAAAALGATNSGRLYCGVYSMYAALQAVGKAPTLDDLIEQKYISSGYGSTLADLKQIADDYGVSAVPMKGMTVGMLRDAQGPVVLHTRRPRRGSPYQHWIVFLGVENGMARIVDPPGAVETISFSNVLAQWDGVGLLISETPVPKSRVMRAAWFEQSTWILTTICALLIVCSVSGFRRRIRHEKSVQTTLLLGTGVALAIGYHAASADGFLRNPDSVASVVTRHHASNVPVLSLWSLKSKLKDNPLLIDVRVSGDFAEGSIPGAISFPIGSTTTERVRLFSLLPSDREIIVYCKSHECGWSNEFASELLLRGFSRVSVYRGGYDQWRAVVHSKE